MAKIFINPGHCPGVDPGAVNPITGLQEAEIARKISLHVSNMLLAVGYQTKIVQLDSLTDICTQANDWGADLFVSIHCNGFTDSAANGTETLYYPGSIKGRKLAAYINNQITKNITVNGRPITNRGAKEDVRGLGVLRGTDCPAVLVETAFITNPDEEKFLSSENGQFAFAGAIARGVTDYFAGV